MATMTNTVKIGNLVVYKTSGIWIVRNVNERKELAHEATKADAVKAARIINNSRLYYFYHFY
jgi:hypothetical protein